MKNVEIFTDGACKGNPGPGGWGTILRFGEHEKELSGGEASTTNNRMELIAVVEALKEKILSYGMNFFLCLISIMLRSSG